MKGFGDQEVAVAAVYAEAWLDLAEEQGAGDALGAELVDLGAAFDQSPDLAAVLTSATIRPAARRLLLEKALRGRASDLLVDSLQVLSRKGRAPLLRAVIESYRSALDRRRGRVDVHVRTAVPLTDALRAELVKATRRAGREPRLVEEVRPELVGGLVVQIGDRKFDSSVASRLAHLRAALLDRASSEIQAGTLRVES